MLRIGPRSEGPADHRGRPEHVEEVGGRRRAADHSGLRIAKTKGCITGPKTGDRAEPWCLAAQIGEFFFGPVADVPEDGELVLLCERQWCDQERSRDRVDRGASADAEGECEDR